jgi:hypothetical protein
MRAAVLGFAVAAIVVLAMPAAAADVTGTWHCTVKLDMGTGSPTFVFQQEGDKLSGTYAGQAGEAKLEGTVTGTQIKFSFQTGYGTVTYEGTIEDADNMKGTADYGGQASGTWTATRAKE